MRGSITPVIPRGETIWFEYNPPEFETAKDVNWAEIGVPGSDFPLQQFVRGGLQTLTEGRAPQKLHCLCPPGFNTESVSHDVGRTHYKVILHSYD